MPVMMLWHSDEGSWKTAVWMKLRENLLTLLASLKCVSQNKMKLFAFQCFCCNNCFPIESTSHQYNHNYLISDKSWMHTPEALAKHYIGYNAKVRVRPASPSALNFITLEDQRCTQEDHALSFCSSEASPQPELHASSFCIRTPTCC